MVLKHSKVQLYEGRSWIWSNQWMCWRVCIEDYDCVVWVMSEKRYRSGLMATRLCVILYSIVTLAMFLRVSREFHSRGSSIDVTLLVLWNLPVVYLAALRWTTGARCVRKNSIFFSDAPSPCALNLFYFAFLKFIFVVYENLVPNVKK